MIDTRAAWVPSLASPLGCAYMPTTPLDDDITPPTSFPCGIGITLASTPCRAALRQSPTQLIPTLTTPAAVPLPMNSKMSALRQCATVRLLCSSTQSVPLRQLCLRRQPPSSILQDAAELRSCRRNFVPWFSLFTRGRNGSSV